MINFESGVIYNFKNLNQKTSKEFMLYNIYIKMNALFYFLQVMHRINLVVCETSALIRTLVKFGLSSVHNTRYDFQNNRYYWIIFEDKLCNAHFYPQAISDRVFEGLLSAPVHTGVHGSESIGQICFHFYHAFSLY